MNGLETGDWALLAAAAYVAIITLVRLMIRHRRGFSDRLAVEVERRRQAKAAEERLKEEETKQQSARAA